MTCVAVCQNNCSGHGQCDQATKRCVCSGFWMENFFLANFGERQSNCGELISMLCYWERCLGTLWTSYLRPQMCAAVSWVIFFWSSFCWTPL